MLKLKILIASIFLMNFQDSHQWWESRNENAVERLKSAYKNKLLPLEQVSLFHRMHSQPFHDQDFNSTSMILLIGQYSTGKTSFIKYILEEEYPGSRIGPEPTTDAFYVVRHGEYNVTIPGNSFVADTELNFQELSSFGNAFLENFFGSTIKNEKLKFISFIDTPGILSGEKQRLNRGYDFIEVVKWFAEKSDRIILFFDSHKLDISDEFKNCINAILPFEEKIRIVLNKADSLNNQELMRVYGALMWSLGRVMDKPEVCRVYISSFRKQSYQHNNHAKLFDMEAWDLIQDLEELHKKALQNKISGLSRRARQAKAHAFLMHEIAENKPWLFINQYKEDVIKNLEKIYEAVIQKYFVPKGDLSDVNEMKIKLQHLDFKLLNKIDKKIV